MKKIYRVKKKESLTENIRSVLPEMFDDLMSYSGIVMNYPLRKDDLHEMRKAGKPLRYTMELGEYCFSAEFKQCLDEIKEALELMGEIHDADVIIPELTMHIKEIRLFNNTLTEKTQRISTRSMRDAVSGLRESRRKMYAELCAKLGEWIKNDFRARLIKTMEQTKQ